MSLRSPTENENGRFARHDSPATRHSRVRGNPGLFWRIRLVTRPRFREGMLSNRGYDGTQPLSRQLLPFRTRTFRRKHEGHEKKSRLMSKKRNNLLAIVILFGLQPILTTASI